MAKYKPRKRNITARVQPLIVLFLAGIFGGYVLWIQGTQPPPLPPDQPNQAEVETFLAANIRPLLPLEPNVLEVAKESSLESIISTITDIPVAASLEGNRLNHIYGYIGAEQHLPRYHGDRLTLADRLRRAGMTSAPGAFGYFADSRAELTPEAILQEQYYIAAQTLYLSEWNENWVELKPWYKFRKMLVVNPTNGKAVVAVVGDAGPAWFTGKQFGGSPEVMNFLQLKDGAQKKRVVILFVDEQRASNEIPLGPVKYQ